MHLQELDDVKFAHASHDVDIAHASHCLYMQRIHNLHDPGWAQMDEKQQVQLEKAAEDQRYMEILEEQDSRQQQQ